VFGADALQGSGWYKGHAMEQPPLHLPKVSAMAAERGEPAVPFDRRYPTVASATVRVSEMSGGPERVFRKREIGTYVDCVEPLCDGGGFRIDRLLDEMVAKGERTREEMATCIGQQRASGRGKRPGRVLGHCTRIYRVDIELKLRKSRP
jgi:hypothetical protein